MLPVSFSIWGTCVSIEIFERFSKNNRIVSTRPLRCNSIINASERFPDKLLIEHTSSYIKPMLTAMFEGSCEDYLNRNLGDYILIDMIEERFPLLKINETYVLQSTWWDNSNIWKLLDEEGYLLNKMDHDELPWDFVDDKITKFCNMIKRMYNPSHIIINETYLVDKYVDADGNTQFFSNIEDIERINRYLKIYYENIKNQLGVDARTLRMPEDTIADACHSRGLSPVHFTKEYYQQMYQKIIKLIDTDLSMQKKVPLIEKKIEFTTNQNIRSICKQFELPMYLTNYLGFVENISSLKGKRVLWLGKPLISHDLSRKLGVKKWVCFDLINSSYVDKKERYVTDLSDIYENKVLAAGMEELIEYNNYIIFRGMEYKIASCFFNKFDLILSRNYLESSENISYLFEIIYKCLRNGGEFIGMINPIWSGPGGGRWHIGSDNFTNSSRVPRFAHLLCGYQDLYKILLTNYDPKMYDFYQISKMILNGSK